MRDTVVIGGEAHSLSQIDGGADLLLQTDGQSGVDIDIEGEADLLTQIDGDAGLLLQGDGQSGVYINVGGVVYDTYDGPYSVTPATTEQTLETEGMLMREDVTVTGIPYYETTNEAGGYTAIIG